MLKRDLSCEYSEIFKNSFFIEYFQWLLLLLAIRFSLPALLNVFNCIISLLVLSYPMAFLIAFSKKLLENHFLLKNIMFRKNRFMNKRFLDNTKLATKNISICCFSAAPQDLTLRRLLITWTPVKN